MSESTLFNPKKSADVFDLKGNKLKTQIILWVKSQPGETNMQQISMI